MFLLQYVRASFLSIVALLSCFVLSVIPQSAEVAADTRLATLSVVGETEFHLVTTPSCIMRMLGLFSVQKSNEFYILRSLIKFFRCFSQDQIQGLLKSWKLDAIFGSVLITSDLLKT